MAKNQNMEIIDLIAEAIDTVVDDYDSVIMDPPPALGMVSMAVLQAAISTVIPVPPSLVDFASTVSFIDMTRTPMKQLEKLAVRWRPAYNFIRLVGSRKIGRALCWERVCTKVLFSEVAVALKKKYI